MMAMSANLKVRGTCAKKMAPSHYVEDRDDMFCSIVELVRGTSLEAYAHTTSQTLTSSHVS